MTHDEFQQLAAAGPMTPEQQEQLRQHVESCPECLSAEREQAVGDIEGRSAAWWLAIPAIFFLALWIWREVAVRAAREEIRSQRAEIVELTNAEKVLKTQKEKLSGDLAVISAPGVQSIAMTAPAGSAADGTLYVDPSSRRAVLAARSLAKTDEQHDYEVWLYPPEGAPRSGGIFDVTNGHTTVSVPDFPPVVKNVAVTLEKNGGAPQPGPDVVLSGHP